MFKLYLSHQGLILLLSIIIALVFGVMTPHIFNSLGFISVIFINLLKLCAIPIILTSLIVSIGLLSLNSLALKRVVLNSVGYILLSEIIAVIIGLSVFNLIDTSKWLNKEIVFKQASKYIISTSSASFDIKHIFTDNIFQSLANADIVAITVFSIMVGIACAINVEHGKPLIKLCINVREVFLRLLNVVMYLLPFAIFSLVGESVAQNYLNGVLADNLFGLLKFLLLFMIALFIHLTWQVILVLYMNRNLTLKRLFFESAPIFITAYNTSSSIATLPAAVRTASSLGGKTDVVNFMLPISAALNFSSGMMYELVAAIFFLHVLGLHPSMTNQIYLAGFCILTGITFGGMPEMSMVSFVFVFNMANIPLKAINVLLPFDRILDRLRTMVNIFGNTCGALIVSKIKH